MEQTLLHSQERCEIHLVLKYSTRTEESHTARRAYLPLRASQGRTRHLFPGFSPFRVPKGKVTK